MELICVKSIGPWWEPNIHDIFFESNSSELLDWYCLILIGFVWNILHLSLCTNIISHDNT